MTKQEQYDFVNALLDNVKFGIQNKVEKFPDSWDGFEIRQYVADKVSESVNWCPMDRKRKKDYKNYCIVNGI